MQVDLSLPIVVAIIINLIVVSFSYGSLSQTVKDLCRRVTSLEDRERTRNSS